MARQTRRPQHPNAALTPAARLKMVRLVTDDGWSVTAATQRFQVGASRGVVDFGVEPR